MKNIIPIIVGFILSIMVGIIITLLGMKEFSVGWYSASAFFLTVFCPYWKFKRKNNGN
jgi:hypothetical protein